MQLDYTYDDCVQRSIQVRWELDDVMTADAELDFGRHFLPQSLAPTDLPFLHDNEQRVLNQIAGNAYLNLFQFVEEYILAVMMQHASAELFGEPSHLRALTRFVDEELKHQQLFQRARDAFERGFGRGARVLDNAAEVAHVIMSHSPLAVLLITLHIEWMTQQHYTACVRDDVDIDPLFKSMLHHHWLEEAQHARIDTLELAAIANAASDEQKSTAIGEYMGIIDAFDGLLKAQSDYDLAAFETKTGRTLDGDEKQSLVAKQLAGYRRTFIWHGMTHRKVVAALQALDAVGAAQVGEKAEALHDLCGI